MSRKERVEPCVLADEVFLPIRYHNERRLAKGRGHTIMKLIESSSSNGGVPSSKPS
jgi:hypothetical protein